MGQSSRPASPASTTGHRPQSNWTRSLGTSIRLKIDQDKLESQDYEWIEISNYKCEAFLKHSSIRGGSLLNNP